MGALTGEEREALKLARDVATRARIARDRQEARATVNEAREAERQKLTPFEQRVLKCAGEGMDAAAIARHLGQKEHAVKNAYGAIRRKLRASNMAQAFAVAYRMGKVA